MGTKWDSEKEKWGVKGGNAKENDVKSGSFKSFENRLKVILKSA